MPKVHSTNYVNTLILPAQDCRVDAALEPTNTDSVAGQQFGLMEKAPYLLTSDDVLSRVAAMRKGIGENGYNAFRAVFFSKGQPCFRASPLTKSFGWAVHSDENARVALVDPAGPLFEKLDSNPDVSTIQAMRNRRA